MSNQQAEPGSAGQLSEWSQLSAEQQITAINAVREFTKQRPFWAGQGRDLVGSEALAAAYAAHLRAQLQERAREILHLDNARQTLVEQLAASEATNQRLRELMKQMAGKDQK